MVENQDGDVVVQRSGVVVGVKNDSIDLTNLRGESFSRMATVPVSSDDLEAGRIAAGTEIEM